jgi:hypothetical protein
LAAVRVSSEGWVSGADTSLSLDICSENGGFAKEGASAPDYTQRSWFTFGARGA